MKENIDKAIEFIKTLKDVKGVITGSCLLDYFENQDVDVFLYDEKSFTNIFYTLYYNPEFQILDPLEKWKADRFRIKNESNYSKHGILTIKFMYNTCIPINLILKRTSNNIFGVLSSFDMDIIARGFDLESKSFLDLSEEGSIVNKTATWNKWNTGYYDPELWQMNRILRQLDRVIKYHKRGYNTDALVIKYIEIIDSIQEVQDIFHSENFTEKLKINKENTKIVKKILEVWLKTHKMSEKELETLQLKIREI